MSIDMPIVSHASPAGTSEPGGDFATAVAAAKQQTPVQSQQVPWAQIEMEAIQGMMPFFGMQLQTILGAATSGD